MPACHLTEHRCREWQNVTGYTVCLPNHRLLEWTLAWLLVISCCYAAAPRADTLGKTRLDTLLAAPRALEPAPVPILPGRNSKPWIDGSGHNLPRPVTLRPAVFEAELTDYTFNRLWVEQHSDDYQHSEGGDALNLLLRMGIKTLWDQYRDNELKTVEAVIPDAVENGGFDGSVDHFDYQLRVHGDELRLHFNYEF